MNGRKKLQVQEFETDNETMRMVLNEDFFKKCGFQEEEKSKVLTIITDHLFFKELYDAGRLYIGSSYRNSGLTNLSEWADQIKSNPKKEEFKQALEDSYKSTQEMPELVLSRLSDLKDYKEKTTLAETYNRNTLSTVLQNKENFGVCIELFPDIEVSTDNSIMRSDCYNLNTGLIEFCPLNFLDLDLDIPRSNPSGLLAHELAHVVDSINNLSSINSLESSLKEFYTDLTQAKQSLKAASMLCSDFIGLCYNLDGVINEKGDFVFEGDVPASAEFISFHAQNVVETLNISESLEEFKTNYSKLIENKIRNIKKIPEVTLKDRLFALDSMNSYTKDYRARLSNSTFSDTLNTIFGTVDFVFDVYRDNTLDEISKEVEKIKFDKERIKEFFDKEINKKVDQTFSDEDFQKTNNEIVEKILNTSDFTDTMYTEFAETVEASALNDLKIKNLLIPKYFEKIIQKSIIAPMKKKLQDYLQGSVSSRVLEKKLKYIKDNTERIQKDLVEKTKKITSTQEEMSAKSEQLKELQEEASKDLDPVNYKKQEREQLSVEIETLRKQQQELERAETEFKENSSREKTEKKKSDTDKRLKEISAEVFK